MAQNLRHKFREKSVLSDTSLRINEGEVVGLAGINGAGKTTLIRILAGALSPDSGRISIDDYDLRKNKQMASSRIGWVQENPVFDPGDSLNSVFRYFCELRGISREKADTLSKDLLGQLGLEKYAGYRIQQLSMGMRKRLAVAIAMIGSPKYFLFDELFNGLDPEALQFVKEKFFEAKKDFRSVLISSHALGELQNITDRVLILSNGKLESVSLQDLVNSGLASVKVSVSNPDSRLNDILTKFGDVRANGNTFHIGDIHGDPTVINNYLVKSGYSVMEFTVTDNLLETYFSKRTRGSE